MGAADVIMTVFWSHIAAAGLVRRQVGSRASLEQTVVSGEASRHRGNCRRTGSRRNSRCKRQTKNAQNSDDNLRAAIGFATHPDCIHQKTKAARL